MGTPGTFQAVVEDMLQVLDTTDVIAYLDDVICFHAGFEVHLKGIGRLLQNQESWLQVIRQEMSVCNKVSQVPWSCH